MKKKGISFISKSIFILYFLALFVMNGCGDKTVQVRKDTMKIAKAVVNYIEDNREICKSLNDLKKYIPEINEMKDAWGEKYEMNIKYSIVYSKGPDKKHHEFRNKTWDDDIAAYYIMPYFKTDQKNRGKKFNEKKRKISFARNNLDVIAMAYRDYRRKGFKEIEDLYGLHEKIIANMIQIQDPWGQTYELDKKRGIIFCKGPDKAHNKKKKDSTWKDDIKKSTKL